MSCCETGASKNSQSAIACPVCRKLGSTVSKVTTVPSLKKEVRGTLDLGMQSHFCESPDCDVVYYNEKTDQVFKTSDVKKKVTIKDDSPETPLCYCFKVLKQQALDEIAATGTTDVLQRTQAKMEAAENSLCEKLNPRGDCCTKDIKAWLKAQGVAIDEPVKEQQNSGCC